MDLQKVFNGAIVSVVCIIGVFSWMNGLNAAYGTDAGSTFNGTLERTRAITGASLADLGLQVGNNTVVGSGAAEDTEEAGLISRALRTFGLIDDLLGLIPDMLYDGATILRIPQEYQNFAVVAFSLAVGLTLAFIFLLGVKRLTGL